MYNIALKYNIPIHNIEYIDLNILHKHRPTKKV